MGLKPPQIPGKKKPQDTIKIPLQPPQLKPLAIPPSRPPVGLNKTITAFRENQILLPYKKQTQQLPSNFDTNQYTIYIRLQWQDVVVYSDRVLFEEEIDSISESMYNTMFLLTRIFNYTRDSFACVQLPEIAEVYLFQDDYSFK